MCMELNSCHFPIEVGDSVAPLFKSLPPEGRVQISPLLPACHTVNSHWCFGREREIVLMSGIKLRMDLTW